VSRYEPTSIQASGSGISVTKVTPLFGLNPKPLGWVYDVALRDLREVVVPALDDPFAATRAKGLARLLKYLQAVERSGASFADAERAELTALLGQPVVELDDGRRALCAAIASGALTADQVLPHCLAQAGRDTALMRGAMGALADRHVTPVDQLAGGAS